MPRSELQRLVPQAPAALCKILAVDNGPLDPPIRSEIFGLQRFAQHGRSLGETHRSTGSSTNTETFSPQLKNNIRRLRAAYEYIGVQASAGYDISPAAEWLIENFHLLEAQFKEVYEGLPASYFRTLPVLQGPPLAGLPRVYGVAWAFVAHTDGAFDEDLLIHFLNAYQESCELNLSELWALPTTLRVVLMENLRRLAERVAANKAARGLANLCCDVMESYDLDALDRLLHLLNRRGVGRVFLAQMKQRLQDAPSGVKTIYQQWLEMELPDQSAIQAQLRADQAADNLSVSNSVTSLRSIGDADWSDIVARTSVLMRLMLTSKVFAAEHSVTRNRTLHAIERLSKTWHRSETVVAQTMLGMMHSAHGHDIALSVPSYWLEGQGRGTLMRALGLHDTRWLKWPKVARAGAFAAYATAVCLVTAMVVTSVLFWHSAGSGATHTPGWLIALSILLVAFPGSEIAIAFINRLVSESSRPQSMHRLALADGIPAEHQVMVVIPCMLTDDRSVDNLVHRLHLHYLANPEVHAQFALLSDWVDADEAHLPTDDALLSRVLQKVRELNARHPPNGATASGEYEVPSRFIVLHRERSFSQTEQRWLGWERKRGKLERLINLLAGDPDQGFFALGPETRVVADTRYVITLDSDTQLPPGRLRDLVGVAAHPYNQPQFDTAGLRVIGGYGILQPGIVTPLPSTKELTRYHWLFAGQFGIDTYSAATSEVYQDLFGEGTFTGKGLLNVNAVHRVLSGRLPQEQILSHDLLEGALARCASVTDITVMEDAPFHADVAASRIHRWTRGDWQLLPLLLNPSRHGISHVNRWKMYDNLRRSLVTPVSLLLLVMALCGLVLSVSTALAVVAAAYLTGPFIGAVAGLFPSRGDLSKRHFYFQAAIQLTRSVLGSVWYFSQLIHNAYMFLDAIGRTLYRLTVSHRHLLQWTTAASAHASAKSGLAALLRQHWRTPLAAALLGAALAGISDYPVTSLVLCALWAGSPIWIWYVSRPIKEESVDELPLPDQTYLLGIARDTWRFFEYCVTPADNHLPPDNLQVIPFDMLAHRTSPTNIGLYLLSVACARNFGWIGTQELLTRLEATLTTLLKLQRYQGHFLNWYDTQSCTPLLPAYVSTVDSGNLSGHMLCVAQACLELAQAPFDPRAMQLATLASRERLSALLKKRSELSREERDTLKWLLADHRATLRSAELDASSMSDETVQATALRLKTLAQRLEDLAWEPDFGFLYHRKRQLLHIGFRVGEQQLDAGFYDLLASEARLTSLLAIAKGDIPVTHWASLGRMFYALGTNTGLRSWSGSMFEYTMPSMVLDEPVGSVLREASHVALAEQMAFTKALNVPWGISESAYAGRDHTLAYQYAPQGVPRLALRRTPLDELVIAPYATALASQFSPHEACLNFLSLEKLGSRFRYGFIEALDYSPARQTVSGAFIPVGTFMAHHQGMSIAALANVLQGGVVRRWGMANPHMEAIASLLHERVPREVSSLYTLPSGLPPQMLRKRLPGLLREVTPGSLALEPSHLLSNGRYTVSLRSNGAGHSRLGQVGISRWRDDVLRDNYGNFLYMELAEADDQSVRRPLASLTQHPAPDPDASYHSTFHSDRICFTAEWSYLQTHTTVWVSPEDDIEFREVELRNLGEETIDVYLVSAFEVALSDSRADEAHPAFANMFVRAQWQPEHQALVFERKPRLEHEKGMHAAHFLAQSDTNVVGVRICVDRQKWLGRNQNVSQPVASLQSFTSVWKNHDHNQDHSKPHTGTKARHASLYTGLDPVSVLAVRLRIEPDSTARLTFATAASDSSDTLHSVMDKYRQPSHVHRSSLMSATLAEIRLRALRVSADNFAAIQTLTTALLLNVTRHLERLPDLAGRSDSVCDRRLLWRFGISGDRPIILVSIGVMEGTGLLRTLAQALRLWSWSGMACDLIVINTEPNSYLMALQREVSVLREKLRSDCAPESTTTALYLLRADEISAEEFSTFQHLARIQMHADGRPLIHHVQEWVEAHELASLYRSKTNVELVGITSTSQNPPAPAVGTFASGSGQFHFEVGNEFRPNRPWINVLANPAFGALLSEAGGGYTWAKNSRLNQLTAWSNDPVADPPGEWLLLQDRRTMEVWSVSASAWGDGNRTYSVSHGQGLSTISHSRGHLQVNVSWCVDAESSLKHIRVSLANTGQRTLRLRVISIVEWIMGASRADRSTTWTDFHQQRVSSKNVTVLVCTQRARDGGFGNGSAFLSLTDASHVVDQEDDWTCDRREFFDTRGRLVVPDRMAQLSGEGLDPCAALSTKVDVPAGETAELVFLLGFADSPKAALQLATRAAVQSASQREDVVRKHWNRLLGATTVTTPDPLFDAMVNHWLMYQTVSCRLWAKAGFYQAGGASGFRDQLQDTMALAWAAPEMLRQQIVLCASRQFPEGDVQHWWHEPTGVGVRTHFSDDLLWLPHACVHYLQATDDTLLLEQHVTFIEGAAIPEGEEDAYYMPSPSGQTASVYEHAARTIDLSLRVGIHGLPLMGTGDWNDGMNRVGYLGRGESVWLGWFLCHIVSKFAPLARLRNDGERAMRWESAAEGWKRALLKDGWDGQWFRRAFFDGGQVLGSKSNSECRIDLIAQAWSVLADAAPPSMQELAMHAAESHLVDHQTGLIKLLAPPLQDASPNAGYIQAYPPGVRENGGQYAHAGVWALMAQAKGAHHSTHPSSSSPGKGDLVYDYFTFLSPAHRAVHPTRGPVYGLEPYAMAGDVYSQSPYVGRGGWSWYTGAAGLMHRAAIESIFGLEQRASTLLFKPCLPSHWNEAELTLVRNGQRLHFILVRTPAEHIASMALKWRAQLLYPSQPLAWTSLPTDSSYLIPLTVSEQ